MERSQVADLQWKNLKSRLLEENNNSLGRLSNEIKSKIEELTNNTEIAAYQDLFDEKKGKVQINNMRDIYRVNELLGEGSYGQVHKCVYIQDLANRIEEQKEKDKKGMPKRHEVKVRMSKKERLRAALEDIEDAIDSDMEEK